MTYIERGKITIYRNRSGRIKINRNSKSKNYFWQEIEMGRITTVTNIIITDRNGKNYNWQKKKGNKLQLTEIERGIITTDSTRNRKGKNYNWQN